jgi:hypothetical protein
MTTAEVGGAQGVMDIGASARREIGTKVNSVHDWCHRRRRVRHGPLRPARPRGHRPGRLRPRVQRDPQVHAARAVGQAPGRLPPQLAGPLPLPDPRAGLPRTSSPRRSSPSTTAARSTRPSPSSTPPPSSWPSSHHYDCRLGLGDTGPYELPDGTLLILRDLFVNEEVYHWSGRERGRQAPALRTPSRMVIDPEKMGLDEIRVNDISTTFTRPKNYIEAIVGGAVFAREKWDTPDGRGLPDRRSTTSSDHLGRVQHRHPEALHQDLEDVPPRPHLERAVRLLRRHDPPAPAQGRDLREGLPSTTTCGRSTSASPTTTTTSPSAGSRRRPCPARSSPGRGTCPSPTTPTCGTRRGAGSSGPRATRS